MPALVVLGRISGTFGIKGWVRVFSETAPREGIARYKPVFLEQSGEWKPFYIEAVRIHRPGVAIKFVGVDNKDRALTLLHCNIAVCRSQLPPPLPGEYYWIDLEGLQVLTLDGTVLGTVDCLFETGANDVIVVRGDKKRLIPFIKSDVVVEINLENHFLRVDWDPDF
jgi:16S rRNA processing protein RimM